MNKNGGTLSQKEMARQGGLARARKLDAERRQKIARSGGVQAAKNKKAKNRK